MCIRDRRTGPDLARVGGKYSNDWHVRHLRAPRSVVPESVMPNYPWLDNAAIDGAHITRAMSAMKALGVPYTQEDISNGAASVKGKTEMDAVVAYLQVLGTMVKFEDKDYRK